MRPLYSAFVFAAALSWITAAHAATPVSSCGETVEDGVLEADLDCSSSDGAAVFIADGGTLDLAGHELLSAGGSDRVGVECADNCSIVGNGGTLASSTPPDVDARTIAVVGGRVSITDTTITGYFGAVYAATVTIRSSSLAGNEHGVSGNRVRILSGTSITTDGVGYSVNARRVDIADSTLAGGNSVLARKTKIYRSSVTGTLSNGIVGNVYAEDSVIDANCTGMGYDDYCGDIASPGKPKLVNSSCSHSLHSNSDGSSSGSWSVCSLDP
ncbi:MAG TPA: hypothetical protein VN634_11450 [Candidatus Limnocylindrales bacterium]|nr:hypothetical protein [Candidatus Limnocylindrales bacterium]